MAGRRGGRRGICHPASARNIVLIVTDDQDLETLPYMPRVQALLVE